VDDVLRGRGGGKVGLSGRMGFDATAGDEPPRRKSPRRRKRGTRDGTVALCGRVDGSDRS